MKKIVILLIAISFASFGCNQNSEKTTQTPTSTHKNKGSRKVKKKVDKFPELTPEEHFHAIVNDTMTLLEVSKLNTIGLPYLKTKLRIPAKLNYPYQLKQLKKNFRFTLVRLKTLIEDTKNNSASLAKRRREKK